MAELVSGFGADSRLIVEERLIRSRSESAGVHEVSRKDHPLAGRGPRWRGGQHAERRPSRGRTDGSNPDRREHCPKGPFDRIGARRLVPAHAAWLRGHWRRVTVGHWGVTPQGRNQDRDFGVDSHTRRSILALGFPWRAAETVLPLSVTRSNASHYYDKRRSGSHARWVEATRSGSLGWPRCDGSPER